jgi:hypothetical protein
MNRMVFHVIILWTIHAQLVTAADCITEAELLLRHQYALASIKTMSGKFAARSLHSDGQWHNHGTGTFFVDENKLAHFSGEVGKATVKSVVDNGEVRIVHRNWDDRGLLRYSAIRTANAEQHSHSDVFQQMLCWKFPSSGRSLVSLADLHKLAESPVRVSEVTLEGRKCVQVEFHLNLMTDKSIRIRHWHDIGYRYLIVRRELFNSATRRKTVFQVRDFIEENGAVFPSQRIVMGYDRNDNVTHQDELQLTDLQINRKLPQDTFRLPAVPIGTSCIDMIKSQVYPIHPDWTPSGPSKPHIVYKVESGPRDQATADLGNQTTQVEPQDRTALWVILVSVVLLIAAGMLYGVRKFRRVD